MSGCRVSVRGKWKGSTLPLYLPENRHRRPIVVIERLKGPGVSIYHVDFFETLPSSCKIHSVTAQVDERSRREQRSIAAKAAIPAKTRSSLEPAGIVIVVPQSSVFPLWASFTTATQELKNDGYITLWHSGLLEENLCTAQTFQLSHYGRD